MDSLQRLRLDYTVPEHLSGFPQIPHLPIPYSILSIQKSIAKKLSLLRVETELLSQLIYLQKNQHKSQKWWPRIRGVDRISGRVVDELQAFLDVVTGCEEGKESLKGKQKETAPQTRTITPFDLLVSLERLLRSYLLIEKSVEVTNTAEQPVLQFLATKAFMPLSATLTALLARLRFLLPKFKSDLESTVGKYADFIIESQSIIDLTPQLRKMHLDLRTLWDRLTGSTSHLLQSGQASEAPRPVVLGFEEDVGVAIDRQDIGKAVEREDEEPTVEEIVSEVHPVEEDVGSREVTDTSFFTELNTNDSQLPASHSANAMASAASGSRQTEQAKKRKPGKMKEEKGQKKRKIKRNEIDDIFGDL
ncbi:hypothetical protein BT69DRAFT_1279232 [Atractiella rhizophila]|nr:hypothetical protein BT69DRAFT_1279232 [Atractiella rhizophila]